jgi:hypothetical protein
VKPLASEPVPWVDEVTVTLTVVAARPAGVSAVIDEVELTVKLGQLRPPNPTAVTLTKFVPVRATEVPPASGPLFGLAPVTVGGGGT